MLVSLKNVCYNRDSVRYKQETYHPNWPKPNNASKVVHYKREFVITEFDCNTCEGSQETQTHVVMQSINEVPCKLAN